MTGVATLYERVWGEPRPPMANGGNGAQRQETLDALLSEPQAMCESVQHSRDSGPQEHLETQIGEGLARIASEFNSRLSEIEAELDRQIEKRHLDIVQRIEGLEATIQDRDLTFIESLVTLIELSWRWSWEGSPQTGDPTVVPAT